MASEAEVRAALNFAPLMILDAKGLNGVHRYAIDGTSQSVAIPKEMQGKWLDHYATVDIQFGYGNGAAAPTININETAALGTGDVNAAKDLPAGVILPKRIPLNATFLVWRAVSGSAGGFFSFDVSEQPLQ